MNYLLKSNSLKFKTVLNI